MENHNLLQSYRFGESIDLILAAKSGNIQAFNRLILEYQDPIYSLVSYLCGDSQDSERITQLVFQCIRNELAGCSLENFHLWVFQIAFSVCHKQLSRNYSWVFNRRNHHYPASKEPMTGNLVKDPESKTEQFPGNETMYMQQCLVQLPYKYREVIVLVDIGAMDYASTAIILKISEAVVRRRLSQARQYFARTGSVHL